MEDDRVQEVDTTKKPGCASIAVAGSLLGMMFSWFWSAPPTPSGVPQPPPQAAVDTASMSPAHQLASINADRIVPANDPTVAQFQSLLDGIKKQFPSQNDTKTADQLVYTWNQVKVKEPNLTLLEFTKKFASINVHGLGK